MKRERKRAKRDNIYIGAEVAKYIAGGGRSIFNLGGHHSYGMFESFHMRKINLINTWSCRGPRGDLQMEGVAQWRGETYTVSNWLQYCPKIGGARGIFTNGRDLVNPNLTFPSTKRKSWYTEMLVSWRESILYTVPSGKQT